VRLQAKQTYTRDQCIAHRIRYVHGEADYESTIAGQTNLYQGPVYRTHDTLRPRISIVQTLAHSTSIASGTAIHPNTYLLPSHGTSGGEPYLECQCQYYKNPKRREVGAVGFRSAVQDTPCMPYVCTKQKGRYDGGGMDGWGLAERQQNPPNAYRTLKHFVYLYAYATEMAYVMSPEQNGSLRAFRKRTYTTLHTMALATKEIRDMRVVKLHPDTQWTRVGHNLQVAWVSEELKAVWYTAIQDIIPKHDRLAKIRLRASNLCSLCGRADTI